MIVRFIVGCVFVGFFKPMINFEMQNCILSNGDAPTPSPHLHHRRRGNELEMVAPEVVGVGELRGGGGFPRAHRYNYAIRSRVYGILETKMMGFIMGVIGKWSKVVVFAPEPAFYYLFNIIETNLR